jgi:Tfp pilus assembly protein PilV
MSRLAPIQDQSGTTLVELLVATAAGLVIFMGLTMVVVASMHQTTRISHRVHATQEARTVLQRIVTELHSSCVAAEVAPIQPNSSATSLSYVYQTGSGAALTPVLHQINLSGTTLSLSTYLSASGSTPQWKFNATPTPTTPTTLMTNVSPVSGTQPIFTYYKFENGQISSTPLPVPLSTTNAALAVEVNIAVKVSPTGSTVPDPKAPGIVQDSALLRFSPPAYSPTALNLPCE